MREEHFSFVRSACTRCATRRPSRGWSPACTSRPWPTYLGTPRSRLPATCTATPPTTRHGQTRRPGGAVRAVTALLPCSLHVRLGFSCLMRPLRVVACLLLRFRGQLARSLPEIVTGCREAMTSPVAGRGESPTPMASSPAVPCLTVNGRSMSFCRTPRLMRRKRRGSSAGSLPVWSRCEPSAHTHGPLRLEPANRCREPR